MRHKFLVPTLVTVLLALFAPPLFAQQEGGGIEKSTKLLDGSRGFVLQETPEDWGDLYSIVPTSEDGLLLAIAFPFLARDPRSGEFTSHWDGIDPDLENDDGIWQQVLEDPLLEGGDIQVVSLWEKNDRNLHLLGYVSGTVSNGDPLWTGPEYLDPPSIEIAFRRWSDTLVSRIDTAPNLQDSRLAAEVAWYTALSRSYRVMDYWLQALLGAGKDCAGKSDDEYGCADCCDDAFFWKKTGCSLAGVLTAAGACSISAACGPAFTGCCLISGGLAGDLIKQACLRSVGRQQVRCTRTCKKLLFESK